MVTVAIVLVLTVAGLLVDVTLSLLTGVVTVTLPAVDVVVLVVAVVVAAGGVIFFPLTEAA